MKLRLQIVCIALLTLFKLASASSIIQPQFEFEDWDGDDIIYGEKTVSFKSVIPGDWEIMIEAWVKNAITESEVTGEDSEESTETIQWVAADSLKNTTTYSFQLIDLLKIPDKERYKDETTYAYKVQVKFNGSISGKQEVIPFYWCIQPTKPKIKNITLELIPEYECPEEVMFIYKTIFEVECRNVQSFLIGVGEIECHRYQDWVHPGISVDDYTRNAIRPLYLYYESYNMEDLNKKNGQDNVWEFPCMDYYFNGALLWFQGYNHIAPGMKGDVVILDDWINDPELEYQIKDFYYSHGLMQNKPEPPVISNIKEVSADNVTYQGGLIDIQSYVQPISLHNSLGMNFYIDFQDGKVNTRNLPSGIYFLRYKDHHNDIKTFKFKK